MRLLLPVLAIVVVAVPATALAQGDIEPRVFEGGVFNSEALKYGIRRLNQLGYFKPLDEKALQVDRPEGVDDKVDVKITVEEENRNQLTFGAGASQYEGFFGNLSYTTSNFLGKGESVTIAAQAGTRSRNYQLSLSEPFLFGRNVIGGGSAYSRKVDYAVAGSTIDYSEVRSGFNLSTGLPLRRFMRGFVTYGYAVVDTAMTDGLQKSFSTSRTRFLAGRGEFTESSITPSVECNTVDNPFAPRSGKRLSMSYQYAGGFLVNLPQMRTSSGVELRVTLPVLNVPFRLIYFWNIYRDSFQPARGFKFAAGTTL